MAEDGFQPMGDLMGGYDTSDLGPGEDLCCPSCSWTLFTGGMDLDAHESLGHGKLIKGPGAGPSISFSFPGSGGGSSSSRSSSTRKLRWGICGTGKIADDFVAGLKHAGSIAEIVAVGSRSLDTANTFGDRHGIPQRFASQTELADCNDVDIVYVSVLHTYHAEMSKLFIEAGKHVVCEKPFAMNAAQGREVVEAARRKGVFVMEAMWTRHFNVIKRVRKLIADGEIGEVKLVQADFSVAFPPDVKRIWERELGGGALLDIGVYPVAFISMVCGGGKPDDIKAIGTLTETGVDDACTVVMRYGKTVATFATLASVDGTNAAVIQGTRGRIVVETPFWCPERAVMTKASDARGEAGEVHVIDDPLPEHDADAPIPLHFPNSQGLRFEAIAATQAALDGHKEAAEMPLDESIAILETLDEIRRQIGLVYPADEETAAGAGHK